MSKKKVEADSVVEKPIVVPKTTKPKVVKVTIDKYFQYVPTPIHEYTRAALKVQFHGIIKTEEEWTTELVDHIRGA